MQLNKKRREFLLDYIILIQKNVLGVYKPELDKINDETNVTNVILCDIISDEIENETEILYCKKCNKEIPYNWYLTELDNHLKKEHNI